MPGIFALGPVSLARSPTQGWSIIPSTQVSCWPVIPKAPSFRVFMTDMDRLLWALMNRRPIASWKKKHF